MATGSYTQESKTMATSNICDGCETNFAVKYCPECNEKFCSTCAKSHLKVKYFKDHKFTDTQNVDELSTSESHGYAKCTAHEEETLDWLCKECCVLICEKCKPDHPGHTIQDPGSNPQLCQRVCSKQIQQLLDELHEMEDIKGILESQIDGYGDAITEVDKWEEGLLLKVKEKATRLRTTLKELKDEASKELSDSLAELTVKIKDIDDKITELHRNRKSMDSETLSQQLGSAQALIANIEMYKEELKPFPTQVKMSDILPNTSTLADIESDLDVLFAYSEYHLQTLSRYESTILVHDIEITNPDTLSGQGYRICTSAHTSSFLILYGIFTEDIRKYDTNTRIMHQIKSDVKLWNMIRTGKGEYIAIDNRYETVHLLDIDFKSNDTIKASHGGLVRAVCLRSPSCFLLFETTTKKPNKGYITTMTISDSQMKTEKEISIQLEDSNIYYMDRHRDQNFIILCSYTHMYKVNLTTAQFSKHDLTKYVSGAVWSFTVDSLANTLVGDNDGNITLFNQAFSHKHLMKIEGQVCSMLIHHGQLCISTTKNRLHMYK